MNNSLPSLPNLSQPITVNISSPGEPNSSMSIVPIAQTSTESKSKSGDSSAVIIALIIVVFALAGFIGYSIYQLAMADSNKNKQTAANTDNVIKEEPEVKKDVYFANLIKLDNSIPADSNTTSTNGRIPNGLNGSGDSNSVSHPSILKMSDNSYYLWYEGSGADGKVRIYHARSSDGINWTKYDNSAPSDSDSMSTNGRIPLGTTGKGDSLAVSNATVVFKDNEFKMWYCGGDGKSRRIFHATSSDALTWKKYDNSIPENSDTTSTKGRIPNGTTGRFDEKDACAPEVIWDEEDQIYKMWYSSVEPGYIGMATSKDALTWQKIDNTIPERSNTTSTNGRISMGLEGSADYSYARNPTILKHEGKYHMWYVAGPKAKSIKEGASQVPVYATSKDGLNWTKYNNAIDMYIGKTSNGLGSNGSLNYGTVNTIDSRDFGAADVIYDNGRLLMMIFSNGGDPVKPRIQTVYSIDL